MELNIPKLQWLPLWNHVSISELEQFIEASVPLWRNLCIVRFAESLGFFVGLDAHLHQFRPQVAKLRSRVALIKRSGVGLSGSFLLYNVLGISIFSHRANFSPSPVHCTGGEQACFWMH